MAATHQASGVRSCAGINTMELMLAIAIVSIGLMVMIQQLSISYREEGQSEQRAFAYQKAAGILQEIQNGIDLGQIKTATDLYALADATENVVLTTRRDGEGLLLPPDHSMSGNVMRRGTWQWSRKISLEAHVQPGLYYVKVDVFSHGEGPAATFQANQSQLVSLIPDADAPVQVFDVYVLALAPVPSLWGDLSDLRTELVNAQQALEHDSRARFRLHWITRLGYGRDPCFAPYVNVTVPATDAAPWAYWLPGNLGSDVPPLYRHDLLGALHCTEAGLLEGGSPLTVTVANQWNHCLRAKAARRLFDQRVAAGLERADEPPLQVLFDLMQEQPERFRGALFVNLHGTGLPMPPLRNYSDAARDPAGHAGVRVVTHPARLQTPRDPDGNGDPADSEDLELRVYAYKTDPATGPAVLAEPITVQIFAPVDLSSAINDAVAPSLLLRRLPGGIDRTTGLASGLNRQYSAFDTSGGAPPTVPAAPYDMYYSAGFVGGQDAYTWLRLYNTPLTAPPVSLQGLPSQARLYGMEYVPSPVAKTAFSLDLASSVLNLNQPKNTARWRIRLPRRLLAAGLLGNQDLALRVVTRIGTDVTTGQRWPVANQPLNESETWAFWSQDDSAVPPTERAQFLGDPRHEPYLDCCQLPGASFPHAYNWHFDNLRALLADATPLWPCLQPERLQDGYGSGVRADAPRFLELWRQQVEHCGAVWISPNGGTDCLLLGGDIARPGTTPGIDVTGVPLSAAWIGSSGTVTLDTVTAPDLLNARNGEQVLRSQATAWWCQPWLGELCPDDQFGSWESAGNVATGTLRWQPVSTPLPNLPSGTVFGPSGATAGSAGALMLMNCGSTTACFTHAANSPSPSVPAAGGQAIAEALNISLPLRLSAARPFTLGSSCLLPPAAFGFTDSYPHSTATLMETHWTPGSVPLSLSSAPWETAAAIAFGSSSNTSGFLVPLGLTPSIGQRGAVARQALMSGVRTLQLAGLPAQTARICEVALPRFLDPRPGLVAENPAGIVLRWRVDWLRFDTQKYTALHADGFAEAESDLVYRALVSRDAGLTWTNVLTHAAAEPDVFPAAPQERLLDLAAGTETLAVNTPPDLFPAGEYLFLVEAWSLTRQCHHGAHRVRVLVHRGQR